MHRCGIVEGPLKDVLIRARFFESDAATSLHNVFADTDSAAKFAEGLADGSAAAGRRSRWGALNVENLYARKGLGSSSGLL